MVTLNFVLSESVKHCHMLRWQSCSTLLIHSPALLQYTTNTFTSSQGAKQRAAVVKHLNVEACVAGSS